MKQWLSNLAGAKGDAAPVPVASSKQQPGPAAAKPSGPAGALVHRPSKPDPVLEHLLRSVRSKHVRRSFFSTAAKEYTESKDIRLLAGTYNVAGKKPPTGLRLSEWLDQWKDSWPKAEAGAAGSAAAAAAAAAGGPDIVVVGFQEVVPLSAGNVIAGPTSAGADAWDLSLASTLNGEQWANRNFGRTYGSPLANQSQVALEKLGSQAAFAYSVISNQANYVMGALDKAWAGNMAGAQAAAEAEAQQKRLQAAIEDESDDERYVQVTCRQMVGLYVSLWAKRRVAKHIRGVQCTSAATGFGGYLGNKGAVAVRLRVYDSPLCVVCSHLASGDQEGDELKRNADYADILKRCQFLSDSDLAATGVAAPAGGAPGVWGDMRNILEHDNVIWLGDLNYRINLTDEVARALIKAGKVEKLLESDQLTREMAAGRVLQGWREGPISFLPTYKYHIGCNVYSGEPLPPGVKAVLSSSSADDTNSSEGLIPAGHTTHSEEARPCSTDRGAGTTGAAAAGGVGSRAGAGALNRASAALPGGDGERGAAGSPGPEKQKKRVPAWCDRVLWLPGHELFQLAYGRGELTVSDHRPVAAAFLLSAHRYQRDKVEALLDTARRSVDMMEMATRPKVSLDPNFIPIGVAPFGSTRTFAAHLHNTGTVDASFYFVPPPRPRSNASKRVTWDDNQPVCPQWLTLAPEEGAVEAGKDKEIQLTVHIAGGPGGGAAALFASNSDNLDAILILRIEDGADMFLSISGSFLRSSFGMDLHDLAQLKAEPAVAEAKLSDEARAAAEAAVAAAGASGSGSGSGVAALSLSDSHVSGSSSQHDDAAVAALRALPDADLVPKEVRQLVEFLSCSGRLHAPGIFVHSYEAACGLPLRGKQARNAQGVSALLAATAGVRWALDTGRPLAAEAVSAHQAAAALLALFHQLPRSFMPPSVTAICTRCVPTRAAAMAMLQDDMSRLELAVLGQALALFKGALAPEAVSHNGLTPAALAAALCDYWFTGGGAVPPELQANRIAFIMTLLDVDVPPTVQGAQHSSSTSTTTTALAAPPRPPPQESLI